MIKAILRTDTGLVAFLGMTTEDVKRIKGETLVTMKSDVKTNEYILCIEDSNEEIEQKIFSHIPENRILDIERI